MAEQMSREVARWLNVREREPLVVLLEEEFGFACYWWWPALSPAELEAWWRAIRNGSGARGAPYFFGPGGWPWPKRRAQTEAERARWMAQYQSGVFYTAHAHWDDDSWLRTPCGRTIVHDEHPDRLTLACDEAADALARLLTGDPIASPHALRVLMTRADEVVRRHQLAWADVAPLMSAPLRVAGLAGAGALLAGWEGLRVVEELDVEGCGLEDAQVVAMWPHLSQCQTVFLDKNPALSMAALRPLREDPTLATALLYVTLPEALDAGENPALDALRAARPAAYLGRA